MVNTGALNVKYLLEVCVVGLVISVSHDKFVAKISLCLGCQAQIGPPWGAKIPKTAIQAHPRGQGLAIRAFTGSSHEATVHQ